MPKRKSKVLIPFQLTSGNPWEGTVMHNGQINWSAVGCGDGFSMWMPEDSVFWVRTPSTLIQLAGYAKFSCRHDGPVYFRGQNINHKKMVPSQFRGCSTLKSSMTRRRDLGIKIKELREIKAFMKSTPDYAYEPLMQHYGFNTKWLDLVDNIWTALWFAVHEVHSTGSRKNYIHFEHTREKFCYIFLFNTGWITSQKYPGFTQTQDRFNIIDLRIAVPSLYLRPHAQHGVLVCRDKIKTETELDYCDRIVGTLMIRTRDALDWLGQNPLTTIHHMFPPPKYDPGYKLFLSKEILPLGATGSVHVIGA